MPYIPKADRERFNLGIGHLAEQIGNGGISNGELNYLITTLGRLYIIRHGKSYNTLSDVVKAMECAKLEFYRRVVANYETEKCDTNGDVYGEIAPLATRQS